MGKITEDSLLVVGGKRGRPRAKEPGSSVSTWIPVSHHDQLVKLANAKEMTVSAFVKDLLSRVLDGGFDVKRKNDDGKRIA